MLSDSAIVTKNLLNVSAISVSILSLKDSRNASFSLNIHILTLFISCVFIHQSLYFAYLTILTVIYKYNIFIYLGELGSTHFIIY